MLFPRVGMFLISRETPSLSRSRSSLLSRERTLDRNRDGIGGLPALAFSLASSPPLFAPLLLPRTPLPLASVRRAALRQSGVLRSCSLPSRALSPSHSYKDNSRMVHDGDLGCTNLLSHDILLLDDIPVRQRHRRIPPSEYEAAKAHINQLLESQVIRQSSSPYASPIVLVRKKDGSLRLCLPRIEESLDALSGARWFSTIDLASGYNQVPVAEQDRPKTAFCTPFGLFEFNRMPFGLCNAPSTFQRMMQRMFGDQQGQSLLLYLDDIIVFSSSVKQHLQRLEMVLDQLQQEGLKAKFDKCAFFQQEVGYLGHVISSQGVSTIRLAGGSQLVVIVIVCVAVLLFLFVLTSILVYKQTDDCQKQFIQTAYKPAQTTITCDYSGNKRSSVQFFCKEDGFICEDILSTESSLKSNGTFSLTETSRGFSVSISNVSSHHAAVYWCGVKPKAGSYRAALRKIQLEVEEDPSTCQRIRSTAQLNMNSGRFSIKDDRVKRNLTITVRGVTADDTGTYWCGAESSDERRSNKFFCRLLMTVAILFSVVTLTTGMKKDTCVKVWQKSHGWSQETSPLQHCRFSTAASVCSSSDSDSLAETSSVQCLSPTGSSSSMLLSVRSIPSRVLLKRSAGFAWGWYGEDPIIIYLKMVPFFEELSDTLSFSQLLSMLQVRVRSFQDQNSAYGGV
ncbi:hypothetical protein L3Q82_007450 [Scortum barcoo]|uniref:Uncharacterized protein n=1 Tax=Scortum barcoo TaxID=214431 RepID=A0ACB8WNB5_9TELE|nr:hypothetical protein L3Q82_007450 [Scortum barcoo]